MKKILPLVRLLSMVVFGLLATLTFGQTITIPAANTNSTSVNDPFGTYYGFERTAVIYTAAQIGSTGSITKVGFYLNSVNTAGAATNVRIYMKTRTTTFTAISTYATETTGATLVYGATTIPASSFTANSWTTVTLSTPFNYTGDNLEIIIETNATGSGNELSTAKQFRSTTQINNQYYQNWQQDTSAPTTTATALLSTARPNVQLTIISACSGTPTGGTVTVSPTSGDNSATYGVSATGYTSASGLTYQWKFSDDGINYTNYSAATSSYSALSGLTPPAFGTVRRWKSTVTCTASSASADSSVGTFTTTYCTPSMTTASASGDYINNVTFAGINNTTGDTPSDYTYYPTPAASVVSGSTYPISLLAGGTSSFYAQQFGVWIDYNNNGVFSDPGEFVFATTASTFNPTPATGNITIPALSTSVLAGTKRMRVMAQYSTAVISTNYCLGSSTFGEYEDYNINITAPLACPIFAATISIGGSTTTSGSLYPSLTEAIAALSSCSTGISQPTTLSINANYNSTAETFPIVIPNITGASATNTITIKPASGVTKTITGSSATAIIKLNGADFITIDGSNAVGGSTKDLTISNSNSGTTSSVIWANSFNSTNGATNNTIKNLNISGNSPSTTFAGIVFSGSTVGTVAETANINNQVSGNNIISSSYGIAMVGASLDTGNVITNNTVGSGVPSSKIGFRAIFIAQQQNIDVSNNTVAGVSAGGQGAGIYVTGGITGGSVNNNKISDIKNSDTAGASANGIYLNSSATANNISVYNNMIWDVSSPGANGFLTSTGIFINTGGGYKLYYNSINLTATPTAATSVSSNIIINAGITAVDIRNNIFANTSSAGLKYNIYSFVASTVFTDINYNDYFSTGNIGYLGVNRINFEDWQSASGKDANSINVQPSFVSATDLHITSSPCSGLESAGTPISGITTDIDLQTRSTTAPDIGADEFTGIVPLKINSVTDGSNCGTGTVILGAVGETGTTQYLWYTNATGGTPLQTTATGSFTTPSISATTTYYVAAASGSCTGTIRKAVIATINPAPTDVVLQSQVVSPSGATSCDLDYVKLEVTGGIKTGNGIIGTGTASSTTTTYPNPLSAYYGGAKHQMIYLASELTAQGLVNGGSINSVGLFINAFAANACTNLTIRMKNTSSSTLTGFEAGTTTVYGGATFIPSTAGWTNFNLTTPFIWDGTSNIIVEFVHNAGNTGNGPGTTTTYTATAASRTFYGASDSVAGGIAGFDALGTYETSGSSLNRPNVQFGFTSQQIVWSPATGLYTDPGLTTTYTGQNLTTVYAAPDAATAYTATSALGTCTKTATTGSIIRTKKIFTGNSSVLADKTLWSINENWTTNTIPTSDKCVSIPSDKNVVVNIPNAVAKSVTVANGGKLTINADQALKIEETLINNNANNLVASTNPQQYYVSVESDGNLLQNSTVGNTGDISVKRDITLSALRKQYNYMSAPVFTPNFKNIYKNANGTAVVVPSVTYYKESTNKFFNFTGVYTPGQGLAVKEPTATSFTGSLLTSVFTGVPYNAEPSIAMINSNTAGDFGYNLLGNPYPSNLDLNSFYNGNNTPANELDPTFYFWNSAVNNKYQQVGNAYDQTAYAYYNASTGTGTRAPGATDDSKKPNGILRVAQGFIGRSLVANKTVQFKNTMRTATATPGFFGKGENATGEKDRYWLNLINPANNAYNIAVVYMTGENDGLDLHDSKSFEGSDAVYSIVDGVSVGINGKNTFAPTDKIQLGTNYFENGNYTIALDEKEGVFNNGQTIYLKDKQNGVVTNLNEGNYTFVANAGVNTGRFEIIYQPETVLATHVTSKEELVVYKDSGDFVVKAPTKKITDVQVFDMNGRLILTIQPNNTKAVIPAASFINGVYLLKVNQNGVITHKKVIK